MVENANSPLLTYSASSRNSKNILGCTSSTLMPPWEKARTTTLRANSAVEREGTMTGANLQWFGKLREATSHPIIAAGGIKTRREIAALEKMEMDAAVGMAMYKNRLR